MYIYMTNVYVYIYMYSQPKDGPKVLVWERSTLLVGLRGWTFSGSETMPFSPSARWGLLDFISACPPLSFRPSVHPSFLVLPCPSFSFLRRTSTASSRSQCSPPAPNSKLRIRAFPAGPPRPAPDRSVLFPAGPQPRAPEQSVPRRTSNARKNLIRYGWNIIKRVNWASVSPKTLLQIKQCCESCNGTRSWRLVLKHGILWNAMVGISRSKVKFEVHKWFSWLQTYITMFDYNHI